MAWLIVCFSEQSVSRVSEKWLKRNGRKCYFPKTKIAMKIKKEAEVDKNSKDWGLYPCRILMGGKRYATLGEAQKAENIAQNHSTMSSFENSYAEKQKSRKHPNVYKNSSASESECDDFKNIDKLKKLDSAFTSDKEYQYNRRFVSNLSPTNQSFEGDTNYDSNAEGDQSENDRNSNNASGDEDVEMNVNSAEVRSDVAIDSEDDINLTSNDFFESQENESNFIPNNNLESTSQLHSPATTYDFSGDRCLIRIEKLIMHACQELETIKSDMKALKIKSSETEQVVEKLVLVCKDLSVEVFSCTEELKKRNGMFTDLLVPDLKFPMTRRTHFQNNELALAKIKIADNMIKYLASTINETKEKRFIKSSFNAIFDTEFLTNKVWWKKESGKVLIKKSKILHCMKESFKLKFGLVEPKKTDKEIEKLIYNTCRNIKDSYRKYLKKAEEDAEKSGEKTPKKAAKKTKDKREKVMTEADVDHNNESGKKAKKVAKKSEKPREFIVTEITDVNNQNDDDWDYEDRKNYKEHKKAKKAAKAKLAANRAAEIENPREGGNMGVIRIAKHSKKRLAGDELEGNVVAKKLKKVHYGP